MKTYPDTIFPRNSKWRKKNKNIVHNWWDIEKMLCSIRSGMYRKRCWTTYISTYWIAAFNLKLKHSYITGICAIELVAIAGIL